MCRSSRGQGPPLELDLLPILRNPVLAPFAAAWSTICRSVVRTTDGGDDSVDLDVGPISTLLEECVRSTAGCPFFLAATLLYTLIEYFGLGSSGRVSVSAPDTGHQVADSRVPIQLAILPELVPVTDLSHVALPMPYGVDEVAALFVQGSWSLSHGVPTDAACHPAALELLRHCVAGPAVHGAAWDQIHVFTDGSFDGCHSSWAFCVFALAGSDLHFLGWAGDRVATSPQDPGFIGASEHSSLHGEQSALAWAAFWALQAPPWVLFGLRDCHRSGDRPLQLRGVRWARSR